jgi:hypothetical protein
MLAWMVDKVAELADPEAKEAARLRAVTSFSQTVQRVINDAIPAFYRDPDGHDEHMAGVREIAQVDKVVSLLADQTGVRPHLPPLRAVLDDHASSKCTHYHGMCRHFQRKIGRIAHEIRQAYPDLAPLEFPLLDPIQLSLLHRILERYVASAALEDEVEAARLAELSSLLAGGVGKTPRLVRDPATFTLRVEEGGGRGAPSPQDLVAWLMRLPEPRRETCLGRLNHVAARRLYALACLDDSFHSVVGDFRAYDVVRYLRADRRTIKSAYVRREPRFPPNAPIATRWRLRYSRPPEPIGMDIGAPSDPRQLGLDFDLRDETTLVPVWTWIERSLHCRLHPPSGHFDLTSLFIEPERCREFRAREFRLSGPKRHALRRSTALVLLDSDDDDSS